MAKSKDRHVSAAKNIPSQVVAPKAILEKLSEKYGATAFFVERDGRMYALPNYAQMPFRIDAVGTIVSDEA